MDARCYTRFRDCVRECRVTRRLSDAHVPRSMPPFFAGTQYMHAPEPRLLDRLRDDRYCNDTCAVASARCMQERMHRE